MTTEPPPPPEQAPAAEPSPAALPVTPPVGWLATPQPGPAPSSLRIVGAAVTVLAGFAGLAALFLPYVSYGEGDPFSLIDIGSFGAVGDNPSGQNLAFALEPFGLAMALLVLGVIAFAARSRLLAGLVLGFAVGLALNHGSFWLSLHDPSFQQDAGIGLYVGLAGGAAALLGGLLLALDRGKREAQPAG